MGHCPLVTVPGDRKGVHSVTPSFHNQKQIKITTHECTAKHDRRLCSSYAISQDQTNSCSLRFMSHFRLFLLSAIRFEESLQLFGIKLWKYFCWKSASMGAGGISSVFCSWSLEFSARCDKQHPHAFHYDFSFNLYSEYSIAYKT